MAVSNAEFDILTVLQSKLEAVAAYERYLQDFQGDGGGQECRQLIEEIRRDDERHAQRLREQLAKMLAKG